MVDFFSFILLSQNCFYYLGSFVLPCGEGNGNPFQYYFMENPMDRGAWQATVKWSRKQSDTTERLHFTHFILYHQRRKSQPTIFLPRESHGYGSLAGHGPWGHRESNMTEVTEQASKCFHMNCENFCPSSVKNAIGDLIGNTLNLQITFGDNNFHNIDSSYSGTWNISPFVYVIFGFFHQRLMIFCVYNSFLYTILLSPQVNLFLIFNYFCCNTEWD